MTSILLLVLPAIAIFALQFFLCRKTENRLIRLIPVGIVALILVAIVVLFAIQSTKTGGFAGHGFLAFLLMGVFASALIGDVLAWIINSGW
ncbi:MAG: hypothetical protein IJX53_04245 [Clostridia bacterium]|nr:hypothetical protein [Clostridia bacterium]